MLEKKSFSIIVALPEEFQSVVSVFKTEGIDLRPAASGQTHYGEIHLNRQLHPISLSMCHEMGNVPAAAATASVLADFSPDTIIFIGICGSLNPSKYRLGDVIIVDDIRSRSFRKIVDGASEDADIAGMHPFGKEQKYRLQVHSPNGPRISVNTRNFVEQNWRKIGTNLDSPSISQEILNAVRGSEQAAKRPTKCFKEQIFSWDLVLASSGYRDELLEVESKLAAVDMESFGFYSVIEAYLRDDRMCNAVVFRGVSDYASYKYETDSGDQNWREIAAKNAASAAVEFIKKCNLDAIGPKP